jgi:hypothetical protein
LLEEVISTNLKTAIIFILTLVMYFRPISFINSAKLPTAWATKGVVLSVMHSNHAAVAAHLVSLLAVLKVVQSHQDNVEVSHDAVEVWPQVIGLRIHKIEVH